MNTLYRVGPHGDYVDLDEIFEARVSGDPVLTNATGFKRGTSDLRVLYKPRGGTTAADIVTGYKISTGQDIVTLFMKKGGQAGPYLHWARNFTIDSPNYNWLGESRATLVAGDMMAHDFFSSGGYVVLKQITSVNGGEGVVGREVIFTITGSGTAIIPNEPYNHSSNYNYGGYFYALTHSGNTVGVAGVTRHLTAGGAFPFYTSALLRVASSSQVQFTFRVEPVLSSQHTDYKPYKSTMRFEAWHPTQTQGVSWNFTSTYWY